MTSSELFGELFVPRPVREAVSDRAWIVAMLDFEAALASAQADMKLIPRESADAIAVACSSPGDFDPASLGNAGRDSATPAAPLVCALTERLGDEASGHVHRGATSQDVMDTATSLVSSRAAALVDEQLAGVAAACAALAERHRGTVMVARTLLQQALPTTFGLKAAGWLLAVVDARRRLAAVPFCAELGGAAGTLAPLGRHGTEVLALVAAQLGLAEPDVPWHTSRGHVAALGTALALAAGTVEKAALDVALLAPTEVGEVSESGDGSRGGSSTPPHKRNPAGSALTIACARRVRGEASILLESIAQEHERAAGAWQAEWEAVSGALAYTGGAASALREALEGLEVRPQRMRSNLDSTGGLILDEAVTTALASGGGLGRLEAHDLVTAACRRAASGGRSLRDELLGDASVCAHLSADEIDAALDPAAYLGSAEQFVDRALSRYKEGR